MLFPILSKEKAQIHLQTLKEKQKHSYSNMENIQEGTKTISD